VATPRPATAFSYLRFSSAAQADGDSVRRQTALRDAWLKRHPGVRLDESLKPDRGVSGYRGEHRTNERHHLAQFLDLVERGRVPAGSFLICENLDRLTREDPETSIPLVLSLIRAGVRVVQLAPAEMVYEPGMDFGRLMMMLWELARGHQESKRKSGLLNEAWGEKKARARADKTPHGRACPAWLELADGQYRLKADAARAVRNIFEWSAAGLGTYAIIDRLNREGIRAFGRSGQWDRSYVHKLLASPAAMGTYQPGRGHRGRTPDGDPILNYYPAAVPEQLWYAARAAVAGRTRRSGRPSEDAFNPFSGLLVNAPDGSKLHLCGTHGYRYLVPSAALQKRPGAAWSTFPLGVFVAAVLSQLKELAAADLFADPGGARVAELTGRLAEVEKRLAAAVARFDADPESPTWADRVSQYDREKRAVVAELAEAKREAAHPLTGVWADAVALMAEDEPERLRAALLATVEQVLCVFVSRGPLKRGGLRLAAVQVRFNGGEHRDYLIAHRQGYAGRREPETAVRSFADAGVGPLDLRKPADAARLVRQLAAFDPAAAAPGGRRGRRVGKLPPRDAAES
jgi:DNA invertase Pin-like site-specific DNA recombinase